VIGLPDPFDWDNYDGQGKSIQEEVDGQNFVVALLVIVMFVLLVLAIALAVWII